jgi:hypothetical protein
VAHPLPCGQTSCMAKIISHGNVFAVQNSRRTWQWCCCRQIVCRVVAVVRLRMAKPLPGK